MDGIEQKVKQVIAECLCFELEEIADNSICLNNLQADSLDFINLEYQLDKAFDGKFSSEMNVGVKTTIQDVIDFVTKEIGSVA